MTPLDQTALIELYESRYRKIGHDVRTLGWNGKDDQTLRFRVLRDVADLTGASICDVGCGFGDLANYLECRFGKFCYRGVDISPELIHKPRELHPELEFNCGDMLAGEFSERADYFLLSGALNYRLTDNWKYTSELLGLMFKLANKAVAVNFLTSYVTFQRAHNYHHSPERVFSLARSLTRWVALRSDYPLWEFTVYLYQAAPLEGPDEKIR